MSGPVEKLTVAVLEAAWLKCMGGPDAPAEMFTSHSTNRMLKAFLAYPNKWKQFLAGLDAVERDLRVKYRWIGA